MYNRVILVPYKMGSSACKALKDALIAAGINCIRRLHTSTKPTKAQDLLIYYGGTGITRPNRGVELNSQRDTAQNKLSAFRCLQAANLSTVEWTTDAEVAATWPMAVARATLTGHSGQGITTHEQGQPLPRVALYTKYMKKTFECRIHVFNGSVIDGQIKKKRQGAEDVDNLVRNVHTGWVYCRDGYTPSDQAKTLAVAAVAALGLDFGAVDLIFNQHYNQYYILEVNTAPGLEGTTLNNYVKAIQNVCNA